MKRKFLESGGKILDQYGILKRSSRLIENSDWEFKGHKYKSGYIGEEEVINELAGDGWVLVVVNEGKYYFKKTI